MRRKNRSGAGLFLTELMIAILFFVLTVTVILQVFVKSYHMSREAEDLFQAQKLAAGAADILEMSDDFTGDMQKYFPGMQTTQTNRMEICYNKEWKAAESEKDARWKMSISRRLEDSLWHTDISVKECGGEELYHLTLQIYDREKGGTGG